ncbi:hypothetical protein EJA72_12295 [Pseudomonas sp. PB120]|uniref:hypothetical protein n=1 Tax=Pseudomonas sp. PB120 TaxID=2494700 RepID=UPI0012FDC507|nr:hypothetical protein [Pseudomonas sp. PB120]MVV49017.1 hypothetical protein [Pseudomonas sp. PB120]
MNNIKIFKLLPLDKRLFLTVTLAVTGCVVAGVEKRDVGGIFGTGTLSSCSANCVTTAEGWRDCSGLSTEMIRACESTPPKKTEKKGAVIVADPQ